MAEVQKSGKTAALLIYQGVSMLELTGNYSILKGLMMAKYEVDLVAEQKDPIKSDTPLMVVPHKTLEEMPDPDILAVLGGGLSSLQVVGSQAVREYVISAARMANTVIGFGTGSVLLAACGLLHQRPAASHWAFSGLLEAFGARYVRERWVEDGKFITTAGGMAGMDMGLKLLGKLVGEKNARFMQLTAEYEPQPPFGGIDWSQVDGRDSAPFTADELQTLVQAIASQPDLHRTVQVWAQSAAIAAAV